MSSKKYYFVLILLATSTSICDADVDIYGNINLGVWYQKPERFYNDTIVINDTDFEIGSDSMDITLSNWIPYGTFGVKYKGGRFGGCIEMGTHLNMYDYNFNGSFSHPITLKKNADFISLDKWYLEWYINDFFTLLAGKSFTPTNFFPSNQLFFGGYGFNNVGCLYTGAYPMFQLTVTSPKEIFKVKIAVIKGDTTAITIRGTEKKGDDHKCSVKIPKFEGGLKYSLAKGLFYTYGNFAGGFQKYEVVLFQDSGMVSIPNKKDRYIDIPSFAIGGDIGISVGPVTLAFNAFYGENIGIYGAFIGDKYRYWRFTDYMLYFYPVHSLEIDTVTMEW